MLMINDRNPENIVGCESFIKERVDEEEEVHQTTCLTMSLHKLFEVKQRSSVVKINVNNLRNVHLLNLYFKCIFLANSLQDRFFPFSIQLFCNIGRILRFNNRVPFLLLKQVFYCNSPIVYSVLSYITSFLHPYFWSQNSLKFAEQVWNLNNKLKKL